jgi:hypothetical protein
VAALLTVDVKSNWSPAWSGLSETVLPPTDSFSGLFTRSPNASSSFLTASSRVPPPMSTPSTVVPLGTSVWFISSPAQ